jgi:hypothetical protein
MKRFAVMLIGAALAPALASPATAQIPIIVRDGWEAFPNVEYQGGDATQPKKRLGMLVISDSTIALHECVRVDCIDVSKPALPFRNPPLISIAFRTVRRVDAATSVRGPGAGDLIALGGLATDRTEELVAIVYETSTSAEAPVFKAMKTHAAAIEAKVLFRMRKLGIDLRAKKDTTLDHNEHQQP